MLNRVSAKTFNFICAFCSVTRRNTFNKQAEKVKSKKSTNFSTKCIAWILYHFPIPSQNKLSMKKVNKQQCGKEKRESI